MRSESGGSAARLAAVWRTLGPDLAGRGALRRGRLSQPEPQSERLLPYPNAYMYRDWVIQAINDDMPYDQFVKAQIAGDLMDESDRYKMSGDRLPGPGPWYFDNGAVEVTRADERHDRVDVMTRGFLGLTVALCAVPQPQVRSDSADRLLFAGRCF